jgi:hypothetical protein
MSCSRQETIVLSKDGGDSSIQNRQVKPVYLDLTPGNNLPGLEKITNNSATTIDIDLLAIERRINPNHGSPCIYDDSKTDFSHCLIGDDKFAHIYISTNILMQRYIIVFIRKTMAHVGKINDLIKILRNTVDRLKKADNNFPKGDEYIFQICFFCLYEGNMPTIKIPNNWRPRMNEQIKANFNYIKKPFIMSDLSKDDKCLVISNAGNSLAFKFSPVI